jgi:CheY-like chemotaxis protein
VTSDPLSRQEKKRKILFADDEPDMTTMLKISLERVGFSVDTFNNPLLALRSFRPHLYDLVILDVLMPKMNGFELYNRLKMMDHDIKICFLTASNETYQEKLRKQKTPRTK